MKRHSRHFNGITALLLLSTSLAGCAGAAGGIGQAATGVLSQATSGMGSAAGGIGKALGGATGILPANLMSASGGAPLTPEERTYVDAFEEAKFDYSFVLQGALAGALAGCGAGFVVGGELKDCLIGAGGGAVIGGVGGALVARGNQQQVAFQGKTGQLIATAENQTQMLREQERRLQGIMANLRSEEATLQAQIAAGQIGTQEAQVRRAALDSRYAALENATVKASQAYEAAKSKNLATLDKAIQADIEAQETEVATATDTAAASSAQESAAAIEASTPGPVTTVAALRTQATPRLKEAQNAGSSVFAAMGQQFRSTGIQYRGQA